MLPLADAEYLVLDFQEWINSWSYELSDDRRFSSLKLSLPGYLRTLGIKSVISQPEYIDIDYAAAFTRFYCNTFRPPSRSCTRYLFFKEKFNSVHDIRFHKIANSFCGFMTMWPTNPRVIGGTVLPFPNDVNNTVGASYTIHTAGQTLKTAKPSAMFASKDHGVAVCASIATWLATDLLHRRYDLATCSSAEVTLLATGVDPKWGRPYPQEIGLDNEQIVRALHNLGYAPIVYDISKDPKWIGPLYAYICSGLPVIIICELLDDPSKEPPKEPPNERKQHAVLGVGLQMFQSTKEPDAGDSVTKTFTKLVKSITVHDDRHGPYSTLDLNGHQNPMVTLRPYGCKPTKVVVTALIVPLPQGVVLTSRWAHAFGFNNIKVHIKEIRGSEYNGRIRTMLKRSIDLKEESYKWTGAQVIARKLRIVPMPRWVWVTEAYEEENDEAKITLLPKNQPFARMIIDATQLRFDNKHLLLAYHVDNTVWISDEENQRERDTG